MAKTSSDIKEQLNVLQKNLLDLTMRNQLLNFRPRSRVIKVFDEIPTEIYEILVLNEKKMQFSPKPEKNGQIIEEDLEEYLESNDDLIQNKSELLWELPRPDTDIQDYYKDNVLQTKLTSQELQKRLFNIYQQAKSVFDEQGYNILYLVLGLLEWKEAEQSEDIKKAPLILIPIFMERKGVKRSFKIEWTGDDILTNISLQSKLKEQGIKLPSFEMPDNKDGIYDYFQSVEESIKKMKDWNVRYEIYLGFFSFTKFVMYQDLEAENWPYGYSFDSNPIVKDLFIPNDVKTVTGFNEHEVDVKLPAREIFTVSDADSSQIAVIEDVKKGNNLVVEGPPGTGKSQTIVNLIAELIASGKTVLFVSEKMAALEVVKSRLDSVGLGDFCLELHSRKSNKKEVLKELERTLKFASQPLDINEDDFNVLDGLRTDLNNYPNIIHKPYGKIGFTPFQLFGLKEDSVTHFNKKNKQFPVVNLPDPLIFNKNDWDKSLSKLSDISELLNFIKPIKTNTWKSSNPDLILPAEQQKIKTLLESLLYQLETIEEKSHEFSQKSGVFQPNNLDDVLEKGKIARKIIKSDVYPEKILKNRVWDKKNNKATEIINQIEIFNELKSKYLETALDENVKRLLSDFENKFIGLFNVTSDLFSTNEIEIRDSLNSLGAMIDTHMDLISNLLKLTGIKRPLNQLELEEAMETISKIVTAPKFDVNLIQDSKWDTFSTEAQQTISLVHEYIENKHILEKYREDALDENIKGFLNDFIKISAGLFIVSSELFSYYESEIRDSLSNLNPIIEILINEMESLSKLTGIRTSFNENELEETLETISILIKSPQFNIELVQGTEWNDFNHNATKLINLINLYQQSIPLLNKFQSDVLDHDLKSIRNEFKELTTKKLKFLRRDYKRSRKIVSSFYFDIAPKDDDVIVHDLGELIHCQEIRNNIRDSQSVANSLFGDYWDDEKSDPETLKNIGKWLNTFRTLLNQGKITQDTLKIKEKGLNQLGIEKSSAIIKTNFRNIKGITNRLREFIIFKSKNNEINFKDLEEDITTLNLRVNNYFDLKANLNNLIVGETIKKDEDLIEKLNELIKFQDLRNDIENSENTAKSLFGDYWEGENSDPETLKNIGKWLNTFRTLLNQGKITRNAIKIVSNPSRKKLVIDVPSSKSITNFLNDFKKLNKFLKINNLSSDSISRAEFPDLKFKLERYNEDLPKLVQWSQFTLAKKELPALAQPMIEIIDNDILDHDDLLPAFKGNYADHLLKKAFTNYPELRNFVGVIHEKKIREFNNLDQKTLRINRIRVAQRIRKNIPHSSFNISKRSERGILENEFSRKRGHMPIRRLLYEAGSLIKLIKPCFMMSPLSVAQFIDPNGIGHLKFDVVIFDEASQVKPEDALGTLLRGEQLVVMGDTKQLPPTSFFDNIIGNVETDDYELSSLGDMESILHLCKRSFPAKMLRWHYRSRHESLIAVSNQEFYDNHLFIYPSPEHQSNDLGLKYVNLDWQHASYDRGRSSVNLGEAKAIVKAAFKHFDKYGDSKSLGIGTFNVNQQRAIQEILELELRQLTDNDREKFESYFNQEHEEKFFIKNLETIQGDERDVIFVSVGFGFESTKKFSYNFGPLNREGGERRLNVLLTRAREKCVIYSNFRHSDLEIRHNSPFGLKALKTFLAYAENKELLQIDAPLNDFDSPFEESVYELLRSHGYVVHKQVGCAGYRIDLAVVDPKIPGKYLLGIECDGAMYHSSEVARDRDRLRQQVLEGLGWNIYRIWSTDWYKSREESIDRLLKAVKDSKTNPNSINHTISESTFDEPEIFEKQSILVPETKILDLKDTIPKYEIYKRLKISTNIPLHEKNPSELANAINRIVKFESPVHVNEVFRRIRDHWKIKRTGNRIKDNLDSALKIATQKGKIQFKNDFLYFKNKDTVVRLRTGDPPPRIDLISDEEIEKAIIMVIDNQFATEQKDLILQVSRLLGFKTTRGNISERINSIIKELLSDEELVKMPNGMINLPNS